MKAKPGDIRFEVEWCSELPTLEDGSTDVDKAKYVREHFQTLEQAVERSKVLLKENKDCWGTVRVEEQEVQIDADILEHEGRRKFAWTPLRCLHVDDVDWTYTEKDLERLT